MTKFTKGDRIIRSDKAVNAEVMNIERDANPDNDWYTLAMDGTATYSRHLVRTIDEHWVLATDENTNR